MHLTLNIAAQTLTLYKGDTPVRQYLVSTAKNGVGEQNGSGQTPRGWHVIRAKIGAGAHPNTVFVDRRPTGEVYSTNLCAKAPERDWILTRILWLSGLERGKNRLGLVDTMRRHIYIHGTPAEVAMGVPGSGGCIRMHNNDVIELFELVRSGDKLFIQDEKVNGTH